jgi:hypothetical protein
VISREDVVREWLKSKNTILWGRSFDVRNGRDHGGMEDAIKFIVEMWTDLEYILDDAEWGHEAPPHPVTQTLLDLV